MTHFSARRVPGGPDTYQRVVIYAGPDADSGQFAGFVLLRNGEVDEFLLRVNDPPPPSPDEEEFYLGVIEKMADDDGEPIPSEWVGQ